MVMPAGYEEVIEMTELLRTVVEKATVQTNVIPKRLQVTTDKPVLCSELSTTLLYTVLYTRHFAC